MQNDAETTDRPRGEQLAQRALPWSPYIAPSPTPTLTTDHQPSYRSPHGTCAAMCYTARDACLDQTTFPNFPKEARSRLMLTSCILFPHSESFPPNSLWLVTTLISLLVNACFPRSGSDQEQSTRCNPLVLRQALWDVSPRLDNEGYHVSEGWR